MIIKPNLKLFSIRRISHDTCGNSWPTEDIPVVYVNAVSKEKILELLDKKLGFTTFIVEEIKTIDLQSAQTILLQTRDSEVKTFNEWKKLGRYVVKGAKACAKNEQDEALFHISNTTYSKSERPTYFRSRGNDDFEQLDEF